MVQVATSPRELIDGYVKSTDDAMKNGEFTIELGDPSAEGVTAAAELLTGLRHWCAARGVSYDGADFRARRAVTRHLQELAEAGQG